ncbi:hypothetical protein, partial [Helicobacter sp.]|uniref:acyltransferase n=1 Tax=Helicobacter sp. TaxID=218 RepID=UPI002A74B390
NRVFFAGNSSGVNVECRGDNSLVFIGSGVNYVKGQMDIGSNCVCYIDRDSYLGEVFMRIFEAKNIVIGKDCLFSNDIWLWNSDSHLIYDSNKYSRIAKGESCYIGDHIWFGWSAGGLKKFFIASGSIIGTRSVIVGDKILFSNTANGGYPCKNIRENIFWIGDTTFDWNVIKEEAYETLSGVEKVEGFIYQFEPDKFLNPALIEERLNALPNAFDKLRFLYSYVYCNTNKNRFALFKDSNYTDCKLYCENPNAFDEINFETPLRINYNG